LGSCPVCGTEQLGDFARSGDLRLRRCGNCSLVFTDPQPRGHVRERYTSEYDLAEHFAAFAERKRILFGRHLATLPSATPGSDRLFDIGCADGQFLELAAPLGWRGSGVELNPPAAEAARRRGVEVFEGSLEELDDLPWGSFDLVTAWDVLEHTPRPHEFARRLRRLLKPSGELHLSTLNVDSIPGRLLRGRWSMVVPDHFTYWNRRSLETLLRNAGFQPIHIWTYGLGRDMVRWIDALARWRRRRSGPDDDRSHRDAPDDGALPGRAGGWDSRGAVLAAERTLNRGLRAAGAGVEIAVRAQPV
jgi:2-polyprenyl-3-methyl-5-hydroxy-6-metoxy-1,4-benzoquinol methylase